MAALDPGAGGDGAGRARCASEVPGGSPAAGAARTEGSGLSENNPPRWERGVRRGRDRRERGAAGRATRVPPATRQGRALLIQVRAQRSQDCVLQMVSADFRKRLCCPVPVEETFSRPVLSLLTDWTDFPNKPQPQYLQLNTRCVNIQCRNAICRAGQKKTERRGKGSWT